MRCECGCGFRGEDPVGQYLLEEALMDMLEGVKLAVAQEEQHEWEKQRLIEATHARVQEEMARG